MCWLVGSLLCLVWLIVQWTMLWVVNVRIYVLARNTVKLNEVTAEFDKRLGSCCDRMTQAWDEREKMMNGIVARIIHFQVRFGSVPLVVSVPSCLFWLVGCLLRLLR